MTACKQATSQHSEGGADGEGKQGKKERGRLVSFGGGVGERGEGPVGVGTCSGRVAGRRALPDICERLKSDFR